MTTKLLEIRDVATFIPVLAVRFDHDEELEAERYLLARAGYGLTREDQSGYVLLCQISGGLGRCGCDPYDWGGNSTYSLAHDWIIKHFEELASGDVVDVEFVRGESAAPKVSERLTCPF